MKMKKILLTIVVVTFCLTGRAQQVERAISIIPEPVAMIKKGGHYVLPDEVVVSVPSGEQTAYVNSLLKGKLSLAPGKKVRMTVNDANADIVLELNNSRNSEIGDEGYELKVTDDRIVMRANNAGGLLYGVQTLFQLFPPQIESDKLEENVSWQVPQVGITALISKTHFLAVLLPKK
jgi:hexosaminidase